MKTKILPASSHKEAIYELEKGGVVAIPTETVYGLAARFDEPEAIKKIFLTKQRPSDNPLILHISSLSMLPQITETPPSMFYTLADAFFPGPLTIILRKSPKVPSIVTAGQNSVAVRMPSHPIAREIIEAVGVPLAAPSANLSGRPSPTLAKDVLEDLEGKIPYIVDGGPCEHGIESTVLDLTQEIPALLRPGAISRRELEEFLGLSFTSHSPAFSPGTKYKHYSPNAKVLLCSDAMEWQTISSSDHKRFLLDREGKGLFFNEKNLYALFRQADREGYKEIYIYCSEEVLSNEALMNRIEKASHK